MAACRWGVSLVSLAALVLGHRARIHIAVYGLALGAALVGAELYLQGTERAAPPPDGDAATARTMIATFRANGLDAFGHYCGTSFLREGADGALRSRWNWTNLRMAPRDGDVA